MSTESKAVTGVKTLNIQIATLVRLALKVSKFIN